MTEKLGISGRLAAFFLDNQLTPLLGLSALLLGVFAVLVTPREEEPQINVTMANVIVPAPWSKRQPGRDPGRHADGEGARRDLRREAHLFRLAPGRRRADRAVRSRRGPHRRHRPALQRHLFQPGLAPGGRRHPPAAGQAEGHRRRADPERNALDQGSAARRLRAAGRSPTPSRPRSSASRARATSTPSAVPTRRCTSASIRSVSRATA